MVGRIPNNYWMGLTSWFRSRCPPWWCLVGVLITLHLVPELPQPVGVAPDHYQYLGLKQVIKTINLLLPVTGLDLAVLHISRCQLPLCWTWLCFTSAGANYPCVGLSCASHQQVPITLVYTPRIFQWVSILKRVTSRSNFQSFAPGSSDLHPLLYRFLMFE